MKALRKERGQARSSVFITTLVVAVGFALLVIPVSIMSLAQTAALLGKRVAFALQLVSGAVLLGLGLFLQASTLVFGGLLALASFPFVAAALWMRSRGKSPWLALGVFLTPIFLLLGPLIFAPQIPVDQFDAKVVVPLRQEIQVQTQSQNLDPKIVASMEESLQVLSASDVLKAYVAKTPAERLTWFVLSETGSGVLFLMLLSAFASLLMLDVGYNQILRLQALYVYSRSQNGKLLPPGMVQSLQDALGGKDPSVKGREEYRITSHTALTEADELPPLASEEEGGLLPPLKALSGLFFRPRATWGVFRWYGFHMNYQLTSTPGWHLSLFALPLPLVLGAVAVLCGVAFWPSLGFEQPFETSAWTSLLLLVTFSILCFLALQGMNVFYRRVRTLWAFLLVFILFAFSVQMSYTAYSLMALFGIVGLLDYLYQWRLPSGFPSGEKV